MNRRLFTGLVGWLVLASLLIACGPVEEVEVTRIVEKEVVKEIEVTRVVEEEVVKEIEVTRVVEEEAPTMLSLSTLAEKIRAGEIDVGDEQGMALDQRFHRIHAQAIEMECTQCHVQEAPYEVAQPSSDAPGPVDRRVCLGCHLNGPASKLHGAGE